MTAFKFSGTPVNMGAVWNFNRALDLSRTPLFKWVAHDDLYHPEYLSTCLRLLEDNPDVVLAHSATAFIDEFGEIFPFDPITQTYVDPIVKAQQTPDSPEIGLSQRPVERFRDVLSRARWGSHIFGVIRRDALLRARRLSNFSSCDRAMLAELALLGRFEATRQRLYLKRFHGGGSWALNQKQLKTYLGPHEQYSRRRRQLQAFFSAPLNKPISAMEKLACVAIVAAHSAKTMVHIVGGRDARIAAQGKMWRRKNKDVGRRRDDCIANHEGSIK